MQGKDFTTQKHCPFILVHVNLLGVWPTPACLTLCVECNTIKARVANKRYTQGRKALFLH